MRAIFTNIASAAASLALTAGLVALASPAAASQIDGQPRQLTIQTADLDLGAPAGRVAAERRIRAAANTVCSTEDARLPVDQGCRARAIAQATATLDAQPADVTSESR